ncbi:MAG: dihydrolipoyl dehydrogenase, partial [Gemmatimonadales bacterium]
MAKTFDVIVLGGGPAGYVCAIRCSQLGLNTAVVERDKLGGVCVNIGCIPSKALLQSAYLANTIQHSAKRLGIHVGEVKLDFSAAIKHSRQVSDQNAKGVGFLMKKHKVTVIMGTGTLQPGKKVQVDSDTYTARKAIVIAVGTRVKGIPQIGLEINKTTVISSDEALFLTEAPKTLAIVGAGAVGMEFADIFGAFGSKVTVIEMLPRALPLEDAESSQAITKVFKKRKIDILAGATVKSAKVGDNSVTLEVETAGSAQTIEAEKVLMAAGRALNTENVGLEAVGIKLTDAGFIETDADLRTSVDGYYCIGDIARPPMLAHKGSREGTHVAEVLAGRQPSPIKYDNIPNVTYCHPEVASIGLTEDQCKERSLDYQVGRFPLTANGRAR